MIAWPEIANVSMRVIACSLLCDPGCSCIPNAYADAHRLTFSLYFRSLTID